MNRETRAANWVYDGPFSRSLERRAESEEEPDVCFIEYKGCLVSPLGYCCMNNNSYHAKAAVRVMLGRGADPSKDACKVGLKTSLVKLVARGVTASRSSSALLLTAVHDNFHVFIMMLEYAGVPAGFKLSCPGYRDYIDRHHLRNASKLALAWVLRHPLQREDLVEPILRRVCAISLLEWK
jgi:hypothetical protein